MVHNKKEIQFFIKNPNDEKARINLGMLNAIKKEAAISINDVSKKADTPDDIVANYVNACVKKDLLKLVGSDSGETVKFNDEGKKTLGISFDNENCILNLVDLAGNIVTTEQIPMGVLSALKGRIKEFKEIIAELGRGTRLRGSDHFNIGLAIPEEMVQTNPRCIEILAEGVNHLFGSEVFVVKSATAAGYGEMDSASSGAKNILYMHTDIGIGVVIKDEIIFEESDSASGMEAYLRPWEQFDIANTAKNLVNKGVGTDIVNVVDGDIDKITLSTVLEASSKNDELAEDLVKRAGLALGVRTAYVVNILAPEAVVLGGGTEQKEGNFTSYVVESARRFLLNDRVETTKIVPGVLGKSGSSIGAALLCRRKLFMEV